MSKKAVAAGVVLAIVMLAPVVSTAEGVGSTSSPQAVGEWEFKRQRPARTWTATMTIKKNAEGEYEGTWSARWGESTLSDITFKNGKVKFVQTSSFGGQEMKTTYKGTVESGKITGKGQGRWGEFTFEGTLQGEAKTGADAIVGKWQMSIMMPEREIVEKLTITKNADGTLAGKWEGRRGESTISDVKFEAGKLTFTRTSRFGDREMKTTYKGTVESGKITGKGQGRWGEFTFEGTLQGEAKTGADAIVGKWQMDIMMPEREIVEKLTITKNADGTLVGKWEGRRGESTISDVKFEAGKLTFTHTSRFGDREFTSTFEGTVEGDNMKGVFRSERGEREANATRVTEAKAKEKKP